MTRPQHVTTERAAARRRPRRAVAALLGLALLVPVTVAATSAAWSDDAVFSASLSAAETWPAPPTPPTPPDVVTSCRIFENDAWTGEYCTASAVISDVWGSPGSRTATLGFTITELPETRYAVLDFDLSYAFEHWSGQVSAASWNWDTSGLVSHDLFLPPGGFTSCDLPRFSGRTTYHPKGYHSIAVQEWGGGSCPAA